MGNKPIVILSVISYQLSVKLQKHKPTFIAKSECWQKTFRQPMDQMKGRALLRLKIAFRGIQHSETIQKYLAAKVFHT